MKEEKIGDHKPASRYATVLIALGVAAWVPYAVCKYALGYAVPLLPFLIVHLAGVLPGGYLRYRHRFRTRS